MEVRAHGGTCAWRYVRLLTGLESAVVREDEVEAAPVGGHVLVRARVDHLCRVVGLITLDMLLITCYIDVLIA
jgi:hypothetical protein